ncbi:MAG: exopolysaccharide transport family protein [Rhizobiales bacterium]|nr:exopolysaccharide transport family protein [Hyphomicrobiales bacterium]
MSGANHQQDVDIDLGQLFRAIWKRKGRVLAITVAAAILAYGGARLISPTYRSESRILIEQRTPTYNSGKGDQGAPGESQPLLDDLNIASQVQVLQSVDLIKQVARDLKLYEREEFDPTVKPSAISDVMVLLGLKSNPLDLAPEERVIKEFTDRLTVYQAEKSRVIGIQFSSKDPKLAAAVPNEMVRVYLSLQSGAKLDTNSEAARWLEPEIANLREKVREAEKKVADYRASADLLQTGDATTGGTFVSRQLADISTELTRVRGEKATAEARAENVRAALQDGRSLDTLTDVAGAQIIQRLKETQSQLQAQISDLSTSLLDGHPRIKGLRAQLADVRAQIEREGQKVISGFTNDAKVAQMRERQLLGQLNALKADSARAGNDTVELNALEREAAAQRQLLETYLARYREASSRIDKNATPADARIISRAVDPQEPYFPKVLPIVIVAALAGFVLSSVVIMLMELFSGRALKPVGPAVPAVVAAPIVAKRPDEEVKDAPVSLLADQPEELPAAVAQPVDAQPEEDEFSVASVAALLAARPGKIVISLSPDGDAGSAMTVALARQLGENGLHTVLLDLTGSGCPSRLMASVPKLPGITDLLQGKAAFAQTIHSDRDSTAHVIPQGNADFIGAMRASERLSMIVDALAEVYDRVVVECGPAPAHAIERVSRNREAHIVLSMPKPEERKLAKALGELSKAGYANPILLSDPDHPSLAASRAA